MPHSRVWAAGSNQVMNGSFSKGRSQAAGDAPFGSLLFGPNGAVLREDHNTVLSDGDITAHPELKLARWAARELEASTAAATTMYTIAVRTAALAWARHLSPAPGGHGLRACVALLAPQPVVQTCRGPSIDLGRYQFTCRRA
jgi:hypothetical protein